jgi:uncharacterized protein YdaU (DUF1376 family)
MGNQKTKRMYQPFYWGDYLRDTQHLSLTEHGIYLLLISEYWNKAKPLPLDVSRLHRILRCSTDAERNAVSIILDEFFEQSESGYIHSRIEKDLQTHQEKAEKASERAKKAAEARWGDDATSNAPSTQQAMLTQCQPNQTKPNQTKTKPNKITNPKDLNPEDFKDKSHGKNVETELESFIDWSLAKGKKHKDAAAAFRNWLKPKAWEKPQEQKQEIRYATAD